MEMTPDEIVVNYRQAKNKGQQIKILADLNLCKIEDIIQILVDHGGYERQRISRAIGAARKCSSPVILPKMEFLTKSGIKVREESVVKEHMEFAPEPEKIPYKKPEIISGPPEPVTLEQALNVLHEEIAKITQQQEELTKRKLAIFDKIWKALGVTVQPIQAAPESTIALYNGRSDENESN